MGLAAPVLVESEIHRRSLHAIGHPLAIPRVALSIDLCKELGWVAEGAWRPGREASPEELGRFHHGDYIAAVIDAEREQAVSQAVKQRYNLGVNGNAIYPEMFRRPATSCGNSLLAAKLITDGGIAFNPAGGTHHGRPHRASGYCTFNDPVLAILELLDSGLTSIFYLDLDAHFGDGVHDAFFDEPRVFTLSIHEAGRWPMARDSGNTGPGSIDDRAGGAALNLPVPPGFNDSELEFLMDVVVVPIIERFGAEAIIVQAGADGLADDPMTKLALSNTALWRAVAAVMDLAPRLLVLGGGGYNPWAVARCWAGIWATLCHRPVPDGLPPSAERMLRQVTWNHRLARSPKEEWFTTLADRPRRGPIEATVRELAKAALRLSITR